MIMAGFRIEPFVPFPPGEGTEKSRRVRCEFRATGFDDARSWNCALSRDFGGARADRRDGPVK
jgi:hypothetical protein